MPSLAPAATARSGFRHEALLYPGAPSFASSVAPVVRSAVESGEAVLVVATRPRVEALREELGDLAAKVGFADMGEVGRNPARIIPAWQTFVARNSAPGVRLRGVGEPIFPERTAAELVEAHRHEALLNLAFLDTSSFWLVCPYDVAALPPAVIEEARRTHPLVRRGDVGGESAEYHGLAAIASPFAAPMAARPAGARELRFDPATLGELPALVAEHAAAAGLAVPRRIDLVVAAGEIARNTGHGSLFVWRDGGTVVCELHGHGALDGPLGDREPPPHGSPRIGLWMANQLCDLVQIRSEPGGVVARLHLPAS
jgi:DcmR-like sensory protein